jgi:hypothetical protein
MMPAAKDTTRDGVYKAGMVSVSRRMEETVLRHLDKLADDSEIDKRWLAIARTHIEQGFMALNRSVMRPERIGGKS